ncbi:MAG TPA: HD domain-containing phosphohydrolase [Jiangellaceae bacterium]|jgi:HD-GYP domain-containing protein (c-di-GMP phosphodiesterase class II)|nr:HD domain-containing phosphohydrolase [Jiangellaceae bacterium]
MPRDELRLADLLCALSVTLDLAMAQAPEKSIRACLVATALAREMSLPESEVTDVYYATLLRHLGCTATGHEETYFVGPDELSARPLAERTDVGNRREAMTLLLQSGKGSGVNRLRYIVRTVRAGHEGQATVLRAICEVASMLAERLGLGAGVARAHRHLLERWDGGGMPQGLAGEDIERPTRLAEVATQAVIYERLGGAEAAVDVLRRRSGGWLDPAAVAEFERIGPRLLSELASTDVWETALDVEPTPHRCIFVEQLDELARTFADLVDLKSPYLLGHSTGVAELAEAAARRLGLGGDECVTLRRAALFHDLGRIAVPTGVWEKAGPLTRTQWEQVRLHPYHTERILSRSETLAPIGHLAGMHHERQDGSGYPRQARGQGLPATARILAAADVYQAMTQDRAHRAALPAEAVASAMSEEVRDGRLDAECVRAVLEAAGLRVTARRTTWPAGLSEREVEVLRLLARGMSNPQIAQALVVSPRTAEHHVQHIYAKIGVSTRAGAALFAMQHGLLPL